MSETVKLIIEMPKEIYESRYGDECDEKDCLIIDTFTQAIANGIPLDNDSERAETQAYFAGEAYGWEQGRKALIDDVKAEIEALNDDYCSTQEVLDIIENIGKGDSE